MYSYAQMTINQHHVVLIRRNFSIKYNVPYGRYLHPTICNEEIILNSHNALQIVEINLGEYTDVILLINWDEYNFFYFDTPYRQLLGFNNFKQYTLNAFNDPEQEALKLFCDRINEHGGRFLLSNSYSEIEPGISYFDRLYEGYHIQHITAPRSINAHSPGIQMCSEILVKNY